MTLESKLVFFSLDITILSLHRIIDDKGSEESKKNHDAFYEPYDYYSTALVRLVEKTGVNCKISKEMTKVLQNLV